MPQHKAMQRSKVLMVCWSGEGLRQKERAAATLEDPDGMPELS
jgi:hypothetical protein